ncbi:MAG TPA: VOC family protein [Acidimicrobiales bacterium]|nr:VOC family protein [Acidimicrobiales bacterium]
MAASLTEIVIDCNDAELIANFWCAVLGWPLQRTKRGDLWTSATGGYDARPFIVFEPVPEQKRTKNRVHIDVSPSGCEQAEELERLRGLGATHVDIGQGEQPWIVLADPEGNEFCLLGRRVD